jgi:hypothetical protein
VDDDLVISSLVAAVAASPADLPLRLHLADLLLRSGRTDEAISHAATALAQDPGSAAARGLLQTQLGDGPVAEDDLGEVLPAMFAGEDVARDHEPAVPPQAVAEQVTRHHRSGRRLRSG